MSTYYNWGAVDIIHPPLACTVPSWQSVLKPSMIGLYPVHLHRLPWMASSMSSRFSFSFCLSMELMDITMP